MFFSSFTTQRYYRFAVSCFFFFMGFVFASWASRIPDIKNMLHLSEAGLGGVLFALPIGQLCSLMVSGFLVSKYGSKQTMTVGAVFYAIALLCLGLVSHVWQLMMVLFFFGLSGNLCGISINTQAIGVERLYGRSIIASFHGLWSLAGFIGGIFSTLMVGINFTPFVHFMIVSGFSFVVIFTMRNWVLPRDTNSGEKTQKRAFITPERYVITIGAIAFGSMICEGTMFDWSGVYFEKIIQPPKDLIRLGYIAFMFSMAGSRFLADKFITRFGTTRILQFSGITITSGLLLSSVFPNLISATIGFLLVGIGTSSVVPLCISLAGKSRKMQPGAAIATVSSIGFLGFLIGPPIIGFIAEASSLRLSFMLIAFLGLLTTIMASRIKNLKP